MTLWNRVAALTFAGRYVVAGGAVLVLITGALILISSQIAENSAEVDSLRKSMVTPGDIKALKDATAATAIRLDNYEAQDLLTKIGQLSANTDAEMTGIRRVREEVDRVSRDLGTFKGSVDRALTLVGNDVTLVQSRINTVEKRVDNLPH